MSTNNDDTNGWPDLAAGALAAHGQTFRQLAVERRKEAATFDALAEHCDQVVAQRSPGSTPPEDKPNVSH